MHRIQTLALALATLAGTGGSSSLECGPSAIDLGVVPQGKTVTLERSCRNTSAREIQIHDITTGCSCLGATVTKKTLPPGGKTTLRIELETQPLADRVEFAVELPYRGKDPATERLTISADVRPSVVAFPEYLDMGDFRKGGVRQILVVDTTGRRFSIRQATTVRSEVDVTWAQVELIRMGGRWEPVLRGGAVTGYQMNVQIRPGTTRRSLSDEIQLDLDHDLQKSLRIRVLGYSP